MFKKRRWIYIVVIFLPAAVLMLLSINSLGVKMNIEMMQSLFSGQWNEMRPSCINVLDNMVLGSWEKDKLKEAEMAAVVNFHKKIRAYHGINVSLQHKDNICGNVMHGATNRGITQFRALCDPNGSTPCCFENKCVFKTVEQCRCKNCFDLRQKLHAELSTWIPAEPTCKITMFAGEEDSCKVMKDMTIYFIGDSFIRQLYIAVLSLMRRNKPYGPFINGTPADTLKNCDKHYMLTTECSPWIGVNANECNNTTRLKNIEFWNTKQVNEILKSVKELRHQPNSIVLLSVGLHFQFNLQVVENKVLNPLLLSLANSSWPKVIWLSAPSAGLMKSPGYKYQQKENGIQYNLKANELMRRKGIPILDFFNMTEPVMSFDGTHHGAGVNDLKAQVLLNYLLEIKTSA
ncbi:unnamed protein product [Candidula unifasciata]|uniref:NXPE C-terminal domain-containing protein n=1 Tax=Candidula unifasciata TaxID=100452 RepID=A0A8S3YH44_9EUPU|nr:unnamed protein product [Candidula unifasciata]